MIEKLSVNDLNNLLKNNQIHYYNLYNVDVSVSQYYIADYYKNHEHDTIEKHQNLSKIYTDIEVFTNFEGFSDDITKGEHPITSISLYSTKQNKYYNLFLTHDNHYVNNLITDENDILNYIIENIKNNYLKEFNFEIILFSSENDLLNHYWSIVKEDDPLILTGFNSDNFDYPYIYNRLQKLCKSKQIADNIVSRFGIVTLTQNGILSIPEYTICDILYLMKPRDEGGLNYGKKQDIYSLDYTAKNILGLSKVEHEESLDELYLNKPKDYILYNLVDVILTKLLDDNFQHIHLHNIIRRLVKSGFNTSLHGVSLMYDSFILYQLMKQNKYIRYSINSEKARDIPKERLKNISILKTKKSTIQPINITNDDFRNLTTIYSGAYVKTPIPKIINDGSLIIDLDASSLYPSMILQHNISFDVFNSIVLNPPVYKLLEFLENNIGKIQSIPEQLCNNISKYVEHHLENNTYQNKSQTQNHLYYLTCYLIDNLLRQKVPIKNIFNPSIDKEYFLLKFNLIPLIDLVNLIHPESTLDYNNFIYDYLFNKDILNKYQNIYIYQHPFNSYSKILKLNLSEAINYLKNYCFTVTGCVFEKHENKLGMFTNIILDLIKMRKKYKNQRDENEEGTELYIQLNQLQNSVKVATNSIYGIFGLSTFRYSSHYLAQSITSQGRLVNKIAQYIAENNLKLKFMKGD